MVSFPPCKINLGLQILSKRADGYHNISTCFYPLPWTDILEVLPSDALTFAQTGIVIPGTPEENICLTAYELLKRDFSLPVVRIHLHKIIPVGAGLGGGSSDGAHMLRLLNSLFALHQTEECLMRYASQLGSDCAFFVQDRPMIGKGRGEMLEPADLNLRGYYLRLFNSGIHISTAQAYAHIVPQIPSVKLDQVIQNPASGWKETLKNDFEDSVFQRYPLIQQIKTELYTSGAIYASMSGSGSSVFGIFEDDRPRNYFMKETWSGWL